MFKGMGVLTETGKQNLKEESPVQVFASAYLKQG